MLPVGAVASILKLPFPVPVLPAASLAVAAMVATPSGPAAGMVYVYVHVAVSPPAAGNAALPPGPEKVQAPLSAAANVPPAAGSVTFTTGAASTPLVRSSAVTVMVTV